MKIGFLTSLLAILTFTVQPAFSEGPTHVPQPGDLVVTYKSEFKPEHFKEAIKVLSASLKRVAFEDPAVRDCYVMKNVETHTLLGVVLWDSKGEYKKWKDSGKGKKEIGDPLEQFRVKPTEIIEYELILVDDE